RRREEDNDDVVLILDGETTRLRELYGEYYISEMIRYPDGCRQLIIGEDVDDSAAGVMCLNSTIDIDLLNENFELTGYHGLRKPHENDEELTDVVESTSELLQTVFLQMSHKYTVRQPTQSLKNDFLHERRATETTEDTRSFEKKELNDNGKDLPANGRLGTNALTKREVSFQQDIEVNNGDLACYDRVCTSGIFNTAATRQTLRDVQTITPDSKESTDAGTAGRSSESGELRKLHSDQITKASVSSPDNCRLVSVGDLSSNDVDVQFQSKMQASVLAETMLELSRKRNALHAVGDNETVQSRLIHDLLPRPTYHGEKNAFVLEIFAMRRGMKPHWSLDFLEAAFDCFPDLDYCVILLPFSRPLYQFLQHFVKLFSRAQSVPFRCNRDFPMMLYVLHRAVLFGEIKSRRAQVRDRNTIQGFLAAIPTKHQTLADFDLAMDPLQLDLDCFVFECNDTMLGLAILRAEKQVDFVRSRYHVEDHVSVQSIHRDDYGRLLHFVFTPIFLAYHRFFFREIARLSGLTVIFYRLHHEDESALTRKRPLASCLDDMIPVNPRRQAGYRFPDISGITNLTENDTTDNDLFSLFMTSPRLSMIPPVTIHLRIIVVGASDCGIAFTEYLVLRSSYHYTNLTLISPHGLPFDNKRSCTEISLLPFCGTFCSEYRRCVALRTWINVVYGTMTAINRKEKYVTVMNQGNLAYDYLVLTCGLQYQRPTLREEMKTRKRGEEAIVESQMKLPWNCLTINDDTEASICLKKIQWLTEDLKERRAILFYGRNADCYCALHGLIMFGVNPSWVTLIKPSLNSNDTCDDAFCCDREVYDLNSINI
ncbi:cilia- and flagella-associated protein 61-like, partial [Odontomachus brunneus]|uniref:cilia- and flagella-associated protein 61-like n=1 Tax=Odontomachus brunneus TaxID=486640 RepID=UPI0013F249F8